MNIVGRVPELASGRGRARGDGFNAERAEKDSNAELAERIERRARRGRHVKILGVLLSEPFAAPRSGGRRGWFQTPRSPSSPSVFLQISRGPWRARRFRSSRRPVVGTVRGTAERRSPRTVSNAERAELAERLPGNFLASLARSAFQIVSAASFRNRSRHRGGRRGRFQTPSAPSSPSVFLEISWRPLRARRF